MMGFEGAERRGVRWEALKRDTAVCERGMAEGDGVLNAFLVR